MYETLQSIALVTLVALAIEGLEQAFLLLAFGMVVLATCHEIVKD